MACRDFMRCCCLLTSDKAKPQRNGNAAGSRNSFGCFGCFGWCLRSGGTTCATCTTCATWRADRLFALGIAWLTDLTGFFCPERKGHGWPLVLSRLSSAAHHVASATPSCRTSDGTSRKRNTVARRTFTFRDDRRVVH